MGAQATLDSDARVPSLERSVEADVCIIGAGVAGISTAYELVNRNKKVFQLDARHILSGESGRTSGHLANALDDGYTEIAKKHDADGAKAAAERHTWALNRVGEIAKQLGIDCEFHYLPGYEISQYTTGDKGYKEEIDDLKNEVSTAEKLGLPVHFDKNLAVRVRMESPINGAELSLRSKPPSTRRNGSAMFSSG